MDLSTFAFLIISFGVVPAIFYLWFFYKRDKWEHEPFVLVITLFLFGFIAAEVAGVFNDSFLILTGSTFLTGIISAPIFEESLKWGVVRFGAYNRKEFNEPLDGFVYGAAAALGFAAIENVSYMFKALAGHGFEAFLANALTRGVGAVPAHALFTGISCYCLGVAKFMPNGLKRYGVILGGLGIAMALHATWNGVIAGLGLFVEIAFIIVAWLVVRHFINKGLNRSPFNPTRWTPLPSAVLGASISKALPRSSSAARSATLRFCPRCGAPVAEIARFCPRCGAQIGAESS